MRLGRRGGISKEYEEPVLYGSFPLASCFTHGSLYWRRRPWHPTPGLLPGKSHGWRSLVGCSPWGRWELDTTGRLHFHFHFSALEKEMATHSSVLAWRIPGTAEPGGLPSMGSQSRTRLKRLSSSSSSVYASQCCSLNLSHSPPAVFTVHSLLLRLYYCPANRFISTIFLEGWGEWDGDSRGRGYMYTYGWFTLYSRN